MCFSQKIPLCIRTNQFFLVFLQNVWCVITQTTRQLSNLGFKKNKI